MKNIKPLLIALSLVLIVLTAFKNVKSNDPLNLVEKKKSLALPSPLPPCGIYYQADSSLLGQHLPHLSTDIFENLGYYYSDTSFTAFVPDGYYTHPDDVDGYYYYIEGGRVVSARYVLMEEEGPTAPACP